MRKLMRNVKLVAAASAVLAFMVAAPVVYGGLRWTGFDPELQVGGHKVNITIFAPTGRWCDVEGPVDVRVWVPKGTDARLVSESEGDDGGCTVVTSTTIGERGRHGVIVGVKAETDDPMQRFPMKVEIEVDDELVEDSCRGSVNKWIKCDPVELDNDDDNGRWR